MMSNANRNQQMQKSSVRAKWLMSDFGNCGKSKSVVSASNDPLTKVGFTDKPLPYDVVAHNRDPSLVTKRSWDIALSPLKQIPQNLFLMWMSGNTISIFPIMMVGMLCMRPVQALFSIQTMFTQFDPPLGPGGLPAVMQKAVYLMGLFTNILLAMYKCSSMGLLPLHQSDWIGFLTTQTPLEFAQGKFSIIYN